MNNEDDIMKAYLEMTGQTFQYVMSGAMQYGMDFILELAEKALKENKRIVWKTRLVEGEDLGLVNYVLMSI